MKKLVYIILFLVFSVNFVYSSAPDSLMKSFEKANQFYMAKNYLDAIDIYSSILNSGYESADLYYNIGNAYFRNNDVANARYYYEKALKLDPTDNDIKENIKFLKSQILIDKYEEVPVFFLDKLYNSFMKLFSSSTWSVLGILFLVVGWAMFMVFLFSKIVIRRKGAFIISIISFVISVSSFFFSMQMKDYFMDSNEAIIMKTTTLKSSPEEEGTDQFKVHPGVKVEISEHDTDWYEVKLPNGKKGWVKISEVKVI